MGVCIQDTDMDGVCDGDEISGCQDIDACDFSSSATDPGACDYSCNGCTYDAATNFDVTATLDDGTCIFPIASLCPEDINNDGYVTTVDLLDLLSAYGMICTP
jgi:hypothetical protein